MEELAVKFKECVMIFGSVFLAMLGVALLIDYLYTKWRYKWGE